MQWTLELKFLREIEGKPAHRGAMMAELIMHLVPEQTKLNRLLSVEFLKGHSDA